MEEHDPDQVYVAAAQTLRQLSGLDHSHMVQRSLITDMPRTNVTLYFVYSCSVLQSRFCGGHFSDRRRKSASCQFSAVFAAYGVVRPQKLPVTVS